MIRPQDDEEENELTECVCGHIYNDHYLHMSNRQKPDTHPCAMPFSLYTIDTYEKACPCMNFTPSFSSLIKAAINSTKGGENAQHG